MRRPARLALATIGALIASLMMTVAPVQAVDDVGYVGPQYGTSTTAPTGQKPQSKLWIADGIWWGALFDRVSGDFHIFRYDWSTHVWSDTGVLIDERANMYMDSLWDGSHLYIASAGASTTTTAHALRIIRFSYDPATKTWTKDTGYPVTPAGPGGLKSVVIDRDSTGMLWVTYFKGGKIYIAHSLPGNDAGWVAPYVLPTPNNESTVGSDDLSALVAYDGDKIGVLWSNQLPGIETLFWAWHQDGASDQQWTTQVAYQQPEGADDHLNLKSLIGDSSGRVFAVAKTSMDLASDPLFNLLTLSLNGTWSATQIWNQADDSTRAILQIDQDNRELYVFAAAPCCSGGTIYYKKTSLDAPSFAPGLGTPFIHSDAHPGANNPTSTKQHVTGATGLLVLAGDDQTRYYLHNSIDLAVAPPDTTPPETTITSGPDNGTTATSATLSFTSNEPGSTFVCSLDGGTAASCTSPHAYTQLGVGSHSFAVAATDIHGNSDTTPAVHEWTIASDTTPPDTSITSAPPASTSATSAAFEFTASEPGSTFTCALDGSAPTACSSPTAYLGLAPGSHTFTVAATDPAANLDPTPATYSWTVIPVVLISEDFSSGGFSEGGWTVTAANGGTATVVSGAVTPDDLGARMVSTSAGGSTSSIRKNFTTQQSITAAWDARVVTEHNDQVFTLAKVYGPSGRVLSLTRANGGHLQIQDVSGTTVDIGGLVPLGETVRVRVSMSQGPATDNLSVTVGDVEVYSSATRDLGTGFNGLRLADDSKRRTYDYRVDNIQVTQ